MIELMDVVVIKGVRWFSTLSDCRWDGWGNQQLGWGGRLNCLVLRHHKSRPDSVTLVRCPDNRGVTCITPSWPKQTRLGSFLHPDLSTVWQAVIRVTCIGYLSLRCISKDVKERLIYVAFGVYLNSLPLKIIQFAVGILTRFDTPWSTSLLT